MSLIPDIGQVAEVRNRKYVVRDISESIESSLTRNQQKHHLVYLSSIEEDGFGEEIIVAWEIEPGAKVNENLLPSGEDFDDPSEFDSFLNAIRWNVIDSSYSKNLQAPFRSGAQIEGYQLEPLIRALDMPRANLLIADDVGLGKTIEAGLIAQELVIRQKARRIMIVCPSALQLQWKEQMRDKFGLNFKIVDSELMRSLRRERGIYTNPWTHYPRLITSIDYIKRDRPLRLFEDSLKSDENKFQRDFDLLILDEAHNVAPSGKGKYATDSQRTKVIRVLAPHFEHKLFLTATPHNGYPESFTALLELLDDQRFARGIEIDQKQLRTIMIRRLKSEFKDRVMGNMLFPPREIQHISVEYTKEELNAHKLLQEYADSFTDDVKGYRGVIFDFVMKLLKKRLFSSPAAFRKTIEKHEKTILEKTNKSPTKSENTFQQKLSIIDDEFNDDEEFDSSTESVVEEVSEYFESLNKDQLAILKKLKEYGSNFSESGNKDSKANKLVYWIKEHLFTNGKWNDRRVLIFTEYRDTQKWLLDTIFSTAGISGEDRIMSIYGGMKVEDREKIKAAFQADPKESKVRILLATDAASEGIDLQNFCNDLIHYEIPWNPNRMEQRNGRLDRHGQKADKVNIYHFVGSGYKNNVVAAKVGDLEADLEFLMRAALKIERIREDLGKIGPILAKQVQEAMLGKRNSLDIREEDDNSVSKKVLKLEQDLKKQIEESKRKLEETKTTLHISPNEIFNSVKLALKISAKPELIPVTSDIPLYQDSDLLFKVPSFSGSWAQANEGLLHPFSGKVRPITFDPERIRGRDDVVLAHMNHPLVRLSLNLLRAEVWSTNPSKYLKRLTAKIVSSDITSDIIIVLYSRLLILGSNNQKIQEEILLSGGYLREGKLEKISKHEELVRIEKTIPLKQSISTKRKSDILQLWKKISPALEKAQSQRVDSRAKELAKELEKRKETEIKNITEILKDLEKRINSLLNTPEDNQLRFDFSDLEKDQYKKDREHLSRRLGLIPKEIELETKKIQDKYASQVPKVFPVGVCIFIPADLNR